MLNMIGIPLVLRKSSYVQFVSGTGPSYLLDKEEASLGLGVSLGYCNVGIEGSLSVKLRV